MNPPGPPPSQRDQYDYGPVNDLNNPPLPGPPPSSSSAGRMHPGPMDPTYQSSTLMGGGRPYQVRANPGAL